MAVETGPSSAEGELGDVGRSYDRYADVEPLFRRYAALDPADPRRAALRERLVGLHLPLAENLARRFRNRGEPFEDLIQVARLGLLKAIDRFDPGRGVNFLGYAIPTIAGEVRRHFRDLGWDVRVPRRLQELHLQLGLAINELSQRDGRAPTARTLAAHLGIPIEEVIEGLQAANAYASTSLDTPLGGEAEAPSLGQTLGGADPALDLVENHEALMPLLAALPERERQILGLRFFADMTQSQIAQEIGISQMHVSRLLATTLARLRTQLLAED
ncbi:RNA polymerase sigma factor SigF [Cryptosporangium aurantiacum]|uniref:RNA polymerase sigma-B factor n=1 Tax=Cryptosporangium aurantiacum TaxID=134849 RepID=A0A1M7PC20_9ACTN|nr:RNA polymerase sigma factor SigF [Cryptosporangium aurantiacum]SHN14400.1 RNA polymerase sigma-B factor [Cryptosporangium aurantiacum]